MKMLVNDEPIHNSCTLFGMEKGEVLSIIYDDVPGCEYRIDKLMCIGNHTFEMILDHTTDPLMQFIASTLKERL